MRLLLASAAFLAGCSLLVPLDAASATGGDEPAADAATSEADAASVVDASDGAAADAGIDAALSCPAGALLCDDFERDSFAPGPWQVSSGTPGISTKHARSPSRSFFAAYAPNTDWTIVAHDLPPSTSHVVVTFDLLVETPPTSGVVEVAKVIYGPNQYWDGFSVNVAQDGLFASAARFDGTPSPAKIVTLEIASTAVFDGKFHHVRLDIDPRPVTDKIMIASVDVVAPVTVRLPSSHTDISPAALVAGTTYVNDLQGIDGVFFDDFVATAAP